MQSGLEKNSVNLFGVKFRRITYKVSHIGEGIQRRYGFKMPSQKSPNYFGSAIMRVLVNFDVQLTFKNNEVRTSRCSRVLRLPVISCS